MGKKIEIGDVVTAKEDIVGFMFNIADKGTEGMVVGFASDGAAHVLFRGNKSVYLVNPEELAKAKSFKVKAKKLGLGMKVRIDPYDGWVKLTEVYTSYDDKVSVEGVDKDGQSYYDEYPANDFVEVKA